MDNITHSLVGVMLARVSGKNTAMMVLAANLPDIDIVSWAGGSLTYIEAHRGIFHSLTAAPLMALALMLLFRTRTWQAFLACLTGVLSHLLLDWTNTYGIRLLLPFSGRWLHLDTVDVVDPWIWLAFLLAVAAPALAGLVSSEIGAKKGPGAKRGWAWVALIFLLAYEGGRIAAHRRALAVMGARLYNGKQANRLSAIPNRWTPFEWRGVAEGDGYVVDVPVDLNTEFDPSEGRIDYSSPANEAALKTRPFEVFSKFDQLPFWKVEKLPDNAAQVQLIDLRFGTPERPGFAATAILDASGVVRESRFGFGLPVGR
ncbi:MAG TPA: metal-dependent hydrolase [Bryobacteraceae bacterium]|jgi:inner membrane protein|nr:metal-dependent hydrolase [Bryobacteraceae bacterium]